MGRSRQQDRRERLRAPRWCCLCGKDRIQDVLCANCGCETKPCEVSDDVEIMVNWRELQTLCSWTHQAVANDPAKAAIVEAIARRMQLQYPERCLDGGLII